MRTRCILCLAALICVVVGGALILGVDAGAVAVVANGALIYLLTAALR